ncbi:permease [Streptomyces sp. NBC_01511]|uniref:hypothetical protein n=1 Tax=unclassified Streptomyces TaxID=2593676 RepID=UPI00386D5728
MRGRVAPAAPPILNTYRKYYGARTVLFLLGTFYVAMVVAEAAPSPAATVRVRGRALEEQGAGQGDGAVLTRTGELRTGPTGGQRPWRSGHLLGRSRSPGA